MEKPNKVIEVEPNTLPEMAKKIWRMVRIAYIMLRKGISKSKLMLDLKYLMMKRSKLAGKAINNLMFHHHHHHQNTTGSATPSRRSADSNPSFVDPTDYEFSCSNSPAFPAFHIMSKRRHGRHRHNPFFGCSQMPDTSGDDLETVNAVKAALEKLNNNEAAVAVEASPALPGLGRSPMVRQLRITDSPFPLSNSEEDRHIDKAAEDFINRFYKELRSHEE